MMIDGLQRGKEGNEYHRLNECETQTRIRLELPRAVSNGIVRQCLGHDGEPESGYKGAVPAKLECQESIQRWCSLCAETSFGQRSLTVHRCHRQLRSGARTRRRRGSLHIRETPNADGWKKTYQALRKNEKNRWTRKAVGCEACKSACRS